MQCVYLYRMCYSLIFISRTPDTSILARLSAVVADLYIIDKFLIFFFLHLLFIISCPVLFIVFYYSKAKIVIRLFEMQACRDKYCMKNSHTGAKYSPHRRSGTKRNFNSGRISVILMAVARRGGISAKLDLTETVIQFPILIFPSGCNVRKNSMFLSNEPLVSKIARNISTLYLFEIDESNRK